MAEQARVKYLELRPGRRIIVLSDIHANFEYLAGILDKVGYCDADQLIINGDFLERGHDNLKVIRFLMALVQRGNTYVTLGNCDNWHELLDLGNSWDENMRRYLRFKKSGFIWEILEAEGIDPLSDLNISDYLDLLRTKYGREMAFLAGLPHAIITDKYIFAHAGMDPSIAPEDHDEYGFNRRDRFLDEGKSFDKWLIVGHYPVVLYRTGIVNANPLIERDRKIICIDGGCSLKDDGQLNALIIPDRESDEFLSMYYDSFPTAVVKENQTGSSSSIYIPWNDSKVQVLQRGEEFSRCRHLSSGYELDILTRYLFTDEEITNVNDCTDYVLPLSKGDTVSIVETTSRGYFVKHNGISGWYYGELE